MLRLIGLGVVVVVICAAGIWGVWTYALGRSDMQLQLYAKAAQNNQAASRPAPAAAGDFRVTSCAAGPCVLVEAGGLAFLVGAAEGAAAQLSAQGLLRPDLDAILLTDLSAASLGGLADVRNTTWRRGRRTPLPVYGPVGVAGVVDGVNLMLAASDAADAGAHISAGLSPFAAPLTAGAPEQSEGPGPVTVFDSGVVTILSFPIASSSGGTDWLYRFDIDERSLLVGGCSVRSPALVAAARGAKQAAAVLPAASRAMLEIEHAAAVAAGQDRSARFITAPASACLSPEEAISAFLDARLTGGLLAPLYPAAVDTPTVRAWREVVTPPKGMNLSAGAPGARFNFSPAAMDAAR